MNSTGKFKEISSTSFYCIIPPEKGVLRNFAKFTGKHLSQNLFYNKVEALGLQLYYKRDSGTGVFL